MGRMSTRLPHVLLSASILAAALALTGCSATAGGGSGGSTAAPAAGSGSSAGSTKVDLSDPCTLASVADAQAAVSATPPVTQDGPDTTQFPTPACFYDSDDSTSTFFGDTIADPSKVDLQHAYKPFGAALTPVSGVGDKAAIGGGELDIIAGSHAIVVVTGGSTDLSDDQLIAFGKLLVSRVG
jgi:hypothetical protein